MGGSPRREKFLVWGGQKFQKRSMGGGHYLAHRSTTKL